MRIKRLVIGLGIVLMVLMMAGGGSADATGPQDVQIDVTRLRNWCEYWAPIPPGVAGADSAAQLQKHRGAWAEVIVDDPGAVDRYFACTDWPDLGEPPCLTLPCFVAGEHYITLRAADPPPLGGCIQYNVKGLRGAAVSSTVNAKGIVRHTFFYLNPWNNALQKVCGVWAGQTVELRLMMCPDLDGNRSIDLFNDILGTAAVAGLRKGDPGWNLLADHNEDNIVDLFNDIFAVAYRFGLNCNAFDY